MANSQAKTQLAQRWAAQIEARPIDALRPRARNPRTHSKKQIRQIADSIKTFGFTNPVLIDAEDGVVAGHGRLAAAKLLGMTEVPTLRLAHLSADEVRAYVIADNRLAELAGWDEEILAIELQSLMEMDIEVTVIGFETPEIDLLSQDETPEADPADELPPLDESAPVVSRPGDLWQLGGHRLLCGDALEAESYARLMGDDRGRLVFTDPPYNVPIAGHVSGLGKVKHGDFAMAAGEMSQDEFTAFLATALQHMASVSLEGSLHYICMDWRHMAELLAAGASIYGALKNLCVWNKSNAGMGSLYRSKHELIFVFKLGGAAHVNNVELGRHGRNRSNVWDYPSVNGFDRERQAELALHPTVKPVAMVADAIMDASHRGEIVLDPFAGAGTTILAAERTGRYARAIELEPRYVDVSLRRWQEMTGGEAVHAASGQGFKALAAQRAAEDDSAADANLQSEEAGHEQ